MRIAAVSSLFCLHTCICTDACAAGNGHMPVRAPGCMIRHACAFKHAHTSASMHVCARAGLRAHTKSCASSSMTGTGMQAHARWATTREHSQNRAHHENTRPTVPTDGPRHEMAEGTCIPHTFGHGLTGYMMHHQDDSLALSTR